MHLRAIKLRGFKSFPEAVEVRLEPGVAVVVGPNGSGKSNVADALLWASGSLSPHELRAEKPDDVLFAGSPGHAPADFCEVELLFDNEDGALPELDFSEVSVTRRLHRGGEGQYLINRAAVRRTDLVELLADVGLGGSHGSVISQGKVEEILASKPEERRALIEDAAGLGKFKRRRHRAELKLARVGIQVERARDLEAEVKARLRPLALQATAAERAEKLRGEIAGPAGAPGRARPGRDRRAAGGGRGAARRRPASSASAPASGSRRCSPSATASRRSSPPLPAAGTGRPRRSTGCAALSSGSSCGATPRASSATGCGPSRCCRARERTPSARRCRSRHGSRASGSPRSSTRSPSARACRRRRERSPRKASGWRCRCSRSTPAIERAVAAALARRAAALVAADAGAALGLVERARKAGLGDLAVLVPPRGSSGRRAPPLARRGAALEPCARAARRRAGRRAARPTCGWPSRPTSSGPRAACSSRARVTASTPSAASSGSPARPRRRSCCSSTRAAARWRPRRMSSSAAPRSCPPRRRPCRPARWSRSAERLASVLAGGGGRGRALRGAAAGAGRRGRHASRRAGRGAAQARRRGGRGQARRGGGRRARRRDRRRARAPRGRGGRGEAAAGGGRSRARRGRRPRRARRADRAARAPPRDARAGQPARQGGVRPREGAPDRAGRAARRPRGEPEGARAAARRAGRDGRAPLRRDVRRRQRALRRGRRRRSSRAARAGCG